MSGTVNTPSVGSPIGTTPDSDSRRAELDRALELHILPIVEENGQTRPIIPPGLILSRLMSDFRYELRSIIAEAPWDEVCARVSTEPSKAELHSGNLLIWGYKALLAEREAESDFIAMASDFGVAAEAANALAFALSRDDRHYGGVPLAALRNDKVALYARHTETISQAFRRRHKLAAEVLNDFCFRWIEGRNEGRGFVLDAEAPNLRRYDPSSLSLSEIGQIAHALLLASELAGWVVEHGIIAVIRSQRHGNAGRLPVSLDALLVQQARAGTPRIGPNKLAKLLIAHKLVGDSDDVEDVRRRLIKAAQRHPEPVPLEQYCLSEQYTKLRQ